MRFFGPVIGFFCGIFVLIIWVSYSPLSSYQHHLVFDDPDNFVIMLFTMVLGCAAIYQGWLLNKQDQKLMLSLMAATEANKQAKASSERQLRAYIGVESQSDSQQNGIEFLRVNANNKPAIQIDPSAIIIRTYGTDFLVNRGQTPAYNVQYRVKSIWIQNDNSDYLLEEFAKFTTDRLDQNFKVIGTLGAGAKAQINYEALSNPLNSRIFPMSVYYLLIILMINYEDVFSKKRYEVVSRTIRGLDTQSPVIENLVDGNFSSDISVSE
jgi:hypothetical protein